MNSDQFNNKHRNLVIAKSEMDRKWRMHLQEQEEIAILEAQIRSGSTAPPATVGGGGGGSAPSITEATTILEYNTSQGASLVWNGVTFTLDTSLPNYSYTAIITTIPASTVPSAGSLIEVTVGNSVTSIGTDAFFTCSALTSVTFTPTSTLGSIGLRSFEGCSTLVSITIPSSVTSIGANAFRICNVLASITIPDSVTNIGNYAFNFTNLTTVTFTPTSTLESIGDGAFANNPSLTSITIPNSVTSISGNAFEFCTALTSVTIANGQVGIISPAPSVAFFGVTVQTFAPI